jgi:hypothetical protein
MFDVGAVARRLFNPRDTDLADELHRCCDILKVIRKADPQFLDSTLCASYFLMLSNDGKNYAQLEHAGLDAYVDMYVRNNLWEGRETNQGWPLENSFDNSCALWLMWMTLTKQKLAAESLATREQMVLLTLPYVVLPHRYASACAPPNHFNLPLDSQNPYHQQRLVRTVAPEMPYPIYVKPSNLLMPYFNARFPVSQPLITIAAKLLFVARKEMSPIRAPPHLPQGPGPGIVGVTQEDYREINRSPGARFCRVVTWDWDTGSPKRVGGEEGDGGEIEEEGWEESKVWDSEWWRRLLCHELGGQRPKYLPGDVFKPGSMRGSWHGKEYLPQGNLFVHFLRHPNVHYPGIADPHRPHLFTEASIGLSMKPVFLDVQEYHKICECPQGSSNDSESHPYVAPTLSFSHTNPAFSTSPTSLPIVPQSGRCGVIPIPAPLVFVSTANQDGQNEESIENDDPQPSDALALSLPNPKISIIDYSMANAWFPGHLGGVTFTKLPSTSPGTRDKVVCAVDFQAPDFRSVLNRPEESECLALGGKKREQATTNAYVYETYDPKKTSMHRGLDTVSGASDASPSPSDSNAYPDKCPRCIQREALIRLERKKAEDRSKMMLDRGLRSYENGGRGYEWNQDEDMFYNDGDDDEEMQDVDVDDLGIDMEGLIAQATSDPPTPIQVDDDDDEDDGDDGDGDDDDSSSFHPLVSFGDDEQPEPDALDLDTHTNLPNKRTCYDKSRIGVEFRGIADILLSGETAGPRHAVWQQYKMYGRVRPWDGLIGILRSTVNAAHTGTNNIFIFGYIVGEHNFVGEWRVAASDPLSPTWGNAFVMSRRAGTGAGAAGAQVQAQASAAGVAAAG